MKGQLYLLEAAFVNLASGKETFVNVDSNTLIHENQIYTVCCVLNPEPYTSTVLTISTQLKIKASFKQVANYTGRSGRTYNIMKATVAKNEIFKYTKKNTEGYSLETMIRRNMSSLFMPESTQQPIDSCSFFEAQSFLDLNFTPGEILKVSFTRTLDPSDAYKAIFTRGLTYNANFIKKTHKKLSVGKILFIYHLEFD